MQKTMLIPYFTTKILDTRDKIFISLNHKCHENVKRIRLIDLVDYVLYFL